MFIRERKGRVVVENKGQKAPDSSRHDRRVHQKLIHMYAARTGQWRETLLLPLFFLPFYPWERPSREVPPEK